MQQGGETNWGQTLLLSGDVCLNFYFSNKKIQHSPSLFAPASSIAETMAMVTFRIEKFVGNPNEWNIIDCENKKISRSKGRCVYRDPDRGKGEELCAWPHTEVNGGFRMGFVSAVPPNSKSQYSHIWISTDSFNAICPFLCWPSEGKKGLILSPSITCVQYTQVVFGCYFLLGRILWVPSLQLLPTRHPHAFPNNAYIC